MESAKRPRQWNAAGFMPFRLEVLTPVHIGSGETLSPLEYVLRQHPDGWYLHRVDISGWLTENSTDSAFNGALDSGDLPRIRRLLDEKIDVNRFSLSSSRIPDASLAKELSEKIADPFSRSKVEIGAMLRNPLDETLCLPGSSIKGAISTPIIDWLDGGGRIGRDTLKEACASNSRYGYTNGMKTLFGDISEHAMQALKVSDIDVPSEACRIVRAVERGLTAKDGTPKDPCEVLVESGSVPLYGKLLFDVWSGMPGIEGQGWKCTFNELRQRCNSFYRDKFTKEWNKFYALEHFSSTQTELERVKTGLAQLDGENPPLLLRVGHYAHVECVTVTNNAPETPKRKGCKLPFGTTRTLADGILPFGWVLLHFCSLQEFEAARAEDRILSEKRHAAAMQEIQRRKAAEEDNRRAAEVAEETRRKAREVEAQQRMEQQERQARLALLSPEERQLAMLNESDATEAQAVAVYSALSGMDNAMKTQAARTLKEFWMRIGKWSGKQSKKQDEKIKSVRAIMGE